MRLLRTLLGKIKETYYRHAAWFCERRANKAFDEQDVYAFMRWEELVSKYCNNFVVIRETLS